MRHREDRSTAVADRPDEKTPFPTFTNTTLTSLTPPARSERTLAPGRGTFAESSLDRRFDAVLTSVLFDEALAPSHRPADAGTAPIEQPPLIDTAPKGGGGGGAGPDAAGGGGGNGAASARGGEIKPDGDAAVAAPNGARLSGTGADGEHIASGSEFSGSSESPVAIGDEYRLWTGIGTSVGGNVGDNDSVPAGSTFVVTDLPEVGDLQFSDDGSFSYTLQSDYHGGEDFFVYRLWSGGVSSTAWVRLDLSDDPPLAMNDEYLGALAGAAFTVSAAEGVLPNDIEYDGEPVTGATLDTGPSHGSVALNSDGSFTYTADEDYYGWDSFTYVCSDGKTFSQPATVTIGVNRMVISYDGIDLTQSEGIAWVGEKIGLIVKVVGPGFLQDYQLTNLQWIIGGEAIKNYETDAQSGVVTPLPPDDLKAVSAAFYWIDPSLKDVQVSGTLWSAWSNFSFVVNGKINVLAPDVDLTELTMADVTLQDPWNVPEGEGSDYNGGVAVQLGNSSADPYISGIKAEYVVNGAVPGIVEWFQVMRTTNRRVYFPQEGYLNRSGSNLFDGTMPYRFYPFEDSPAFVLHPDDRNLADTISRSDEFTTVLSFKHESVDSIRVPILGIDWSWNAFAWNDDGIWRLDPQSSGTTGPTVTIYPDLPEWAGNSYDLEEVWD